MCLTCLTILLFFFNVTATTGIYTLSLHDALPISRRPSPSPPAPLPEYGGEGRLGARVGRRRSEEHTSELQSRRDLVCRLLPEKKKIISMSKQGTHVYSIHNTQCLVSIAISLCHNN